MLAALHMGGGLLLALGTIAVVLGLMVNSVWHGWLFYVPGAAVFVLGLWMVTR